MTKVRQSNIELLRIIAMLLVLIVHADFASIGYPNGNDVTSAPTSTFFRIFIESLSIVCVNLFVLISGYFGINPKTKSIFSLIFQVVFSRIIAFIFVLGFGLSQLSKSDFLCIIPGCSDWFVMSYLLLILFSPLINSFIKNISANQLLTYIIIFFTIQTIYGWLIPFGIFGFRNGYSVISMIGLYLLGRYIYLYGARLQKIAAKYFISGYFLTCTLTTCLIFLVLKFADSPFVLGYSYKLYDAYLSPFVIFSSVCLFLFILKFDFRNKVINWIAASVFSVYLIHCNPIIFKHYTDFCSYLFEQYNTVQYIALVTLFILSVFIVAIILDKIRIIGWKYVVKLIQHKFPNF